MATYQQLQDYADLMKALALDEWAEAKKLGNGARCKVNSKKWNEILNAQEKAWIAEHKAWRAQQDANDAKKRT